MLKRMCRMVACRNEYVTGWKIQPCRTNEGTKDKIREKVSPNAGATALRSVVNKNIPALTRTSHFTAFVKGGKLNDNVRPRYVNSAPGAQLWALAARLLYIVAGLPLRYRHDRQTPVAGIVRCLHGENHVVLRHWNRGFHSLDHQLHVFPIRRGRCAPKDFIAHRAPVRRRIPNH